MKSHACFRKGVDTVTRERVGKHKLDGGRPPGVPETFPNLFNLGTRHVSERYLREYRIKQSDKQTPFLSPPSPPSQEKPKLAGMAWDYAPSLHPRALMYVLDTSVSHSECLWDKFLISFSFYRAHFPSCCQSLFSAFLLTHSHLVFERLSWCLLMRSTLLIAQLLHLVYFCWIINWPLCIPINYWYCYGCRTRNNILNDVSWSLLIDFAVNTYRSFTYWKSIN